MLFNPPRYKKNIRKHLIVFNLKQKYSNNFNLKYGNYGLKCLEEGYISPNQLEAARRIFSKNIKKNFGQLWIFAKPNFSKTKKPNEVRMGKGKGPVKGWYFPVKRGFVILELTGVSYKIAILLLRIASKKLSIRTSIVCLK